MTPEDTPLCPYCGEPVEVSLEPEQADQEWIEDCSVCCQPIRYLCRSDGEAVYLTCDRA